MAKEDDSLIFKLLIIIGAKENMDDNDEGHVKKSEFNE